MQRCNAWVSVFLWESSRFHINVVDPHNWEREKLIGIDMYVKIETLYKDDKCYTDKIWNINAILFIRFNI